MKRSISKKHYICRWKMGRNENITLNIESGGLVRCETKMIKINTFEY